MPRWLLILFIVAGIVVIPVAIFGVAVIGGIGQSETEKVADGQAPSVVLLTPMRTLPRSATSITYRYLHWQDSLLYVRFEAPLADARAFAGEMLKQENRPCAYWRVAELEGWPKKLPPGATCAEDSSFHEAGGERVPPITVAIIPQGDRAVVLVATFSD